MRKQARHSEEAPIGHLDYVAWHQGKTPNWAWLAIRAELEAVEGFYRGLGWQVGENAPKLQELPQQFNTTYGLLQPMGRGYEWIIVTYPWDKIDRDLIADQAKSAAKQLTTKTFWTTTIGAEIAYELLDWGDRVEYAQLSDSFTFESKLRSQPGENFSDGGLIDGLPKFQYFIDEVLGDLHLYLFPCVVIKTDHSYGYFEAPNAAVSVAQVKIISPA
jgi:hypothetical protein